MMRFIFTLTAVLLLTGCDPFERLSRIQVVASSETEVGGGIWGTYHTLGFSNFSSFNINSTSSFENSDATKNNIGNDSFVTQFTLRVLDPEGQTLEFIDSMRVYMDNDDSSSNGETEVAFIADSQDTNVRELDLTVYDDRAIGQYLRAEETVIRVVAQGNPPSQKTTIEAEMKLDVDLVW